MTDVLEILETDTEAKGQATRYRKSDQLYCEVTSILGYSDDRRFRRQCRAIFQLYAFPVMRVRMYHEPDGWKVGQIFPTSISQLREGRLPRPDRRRRPAPRCRGADRH